MGDLRVIEDNHHLPIAFLSLRVAKPRLIFHNKENKLVILGNSNINKFVTGKAGTLHARTEFKSTTNSAPVDFNRCNFSIPPN